VVRTYRPAEAAVEQIFMAKNPQSALKLGQARGAAICAVVGEGVTVAEYPARVVKQSVVGNGGADKAQVEHMVKVLLRLDEALAADAADALAVALSHAHAGRVQAQLARWGGGRR
jgi:crossover junction endodeoxyribonuclease RuvC